jgi:hypothetical protein
MEDFTMKLFITRDQAKGLLGGVKFELLARVEITPAESELVKRYKASKEVLVQREVKIPFSGRTLNIGLTVGSLTAGQTFKCADISEILETERNVKEACEAFKNYLEVMKNFGGEEVVEFA